MHPLLSVCTFFYSRQGAVSLTKGKGAQLLECAVQGPMQTAPRDLHALGTIITSDADPISSTAIVGVLWPSFSAAAVDAEDTNSTSTIVSAIRGEKLWVHDGKNEEEGCQGWCAQTGSLVEPFFCRHTESPLGYLQPE